MIYTLRFTDMARAIAERHGGLAKLEEQARQEIDALLADDLECVDDLCFHTLAFGGSYSDDDVPKFILQPAEKDCLLVDYCEFKETLKLEDGPLKGKSVMLPIANARQKPKET